MSIVLTPSVFTRAGSPGDFAWMIEQPDWQRTLFVFNDNETQSQAFLDQVARHRIDPGSIAGQPGGGNAVIRPYQCRTPPRAVGVPTGPGYTRLTKEVRDRIDRAIAYIETRLADPDVQEVMYSASPADPRVLGHGIFQVGPDVLRYVPAQLDRIIQARNRR